MNLLRRLILGPHSITLPHRTQPNFPNRCVVCGRSEPGTETTLLGRDGLCGAALWAGWFVVRVPCCRVCGIPLQCRRILEFVVTLTIGGGWLAFGLL